MSERSEYEMKLSSYPDVATIEDLAMMLGGISTRTAYLLLKRGKIKYFAIRRRYFIPKECVIDFMMSDEYQSFQTKVESARFLRIKDKVERKKQKILFLCEKPQTRKDLMYLLDERSKKTFFRLYLQPLLESGELQMTHPEQPSISTQQYIRVVISEKQVQ